MAIFDPREPRENPRDDPRMILENDPQNDPRMIPENDPQNDPIMIPETHWESLGNPREISLGNRVIPMRPFKPPINPFGHPPHTRDASVFSVCVISIVGLPFGFGFVVALATPDNDDTRQ